MSSIAGVLKKGKNRMSMLCGISQKISLFVTTSKLWSKDDMNFVPHSHVITLGTISAEHRAKRRTYEHTYPSPRYRAWIKAQCG